MKKQKSKRKKSPRHWADIRLEQTAVVIRALKHAHDHGKLQILKTAAKFYEIEMTS